MSYIQSRELLINEIFSDMKKEKKFCKWKKLQDDMHPLGYVKDSSYKL